MKKYLVSAIVLFLASCSSHRDLPDTGSGDGKPPIHFNVASVDCIIAVEPTFEDQFRQKQRLPEFALNLQTWMRETFLNRGQKGTLIVTVEDAGIKETKIPKKTNGIKGFFTYDQSERYDGTLTVRLELRDEHGIPLGATTASVSHSLSVLENISPVRRQKKIAQVHANLIREMDERLRGIIHEQFGGWIVTRVGNYDF